MPIYMEDNKILMINNNAIAMHENCCCGGEISCRNGNRYFSRDIPYSSWYLFTMSTSRWYLLSKTGPPNPVGIFLGSYYSQCTGNYSPSCKYTDCEGNVDASCPYNRCYYGMRDCAFAEVGCSSGQCCSEPIFLTAGTTYVIGTASNTTANLIY